MEEKAVIDRIEDGEQAVLLVGEDERERIVPVSSLPDDAKAGNWLKVRFDGDELVEAVVDLEETERVKERISDKMARLRQRGRRSE
ncbi:MAG: DUF3006 domain-containing protein [Candidatus Paceibacterota bacterium]